MKCGKCGKNYEGNFCPECGTPANTQVYDSKIKICPNCGSKLLSKAIRCPNCGYDVSQVPPIDRGGAVLPNYTPNKYQNPQKKQANPPKGCFKVGAFIVVAIVVISVIVNSCNGGGIKLLVHLPVRLLVRALQYRLR